MSRNEIKIRRNKPNGPASSRFRNYSDVLHRHERFVKIKMLVRVVTIFIITLMLIGILIYMWRTKDTKAPVKTSCERVTPTVTLS